MAQETLQPRSAIPTALTWDVNAIFPNDAAYQTAVAELKQDLTDFVATYTDHLATHAQLIAALKAVNQMSEHYSLIEHYAFLQNATDLTNPKYSQLVREVNQLAADFATKINFFDTALFDMDDEDFTALSEMAPAFAPYLRHVLEAKQIRLAPEAEKALRQLTPVLNAPEDIYGQARAADMTFEPFTVNGKTYPMSFVLYENTYQYNPDTKIRRAAFASFSKTLAKYENTIAATYYTKVAKEKTIATMRGFDSVVDYLLYDQEVDRTLFNRQIDVIMTELGPVMQRYVALIKKSRGLDEMTFADLQIDLDPDFAPKVTIEESKQYISDAISLLGPAYHDELMQAYPERWVDFGQNIGKETGGFEASPYGVHPYILMSWTDELADVYTLVHELGHAGQTLRSQAKHPLVSADISLYLVEAPSTFNELLLTHSLEEKATDNRMRRFAYTKMLTNTYFHNMVTHLLEAAFQREVYALIDEGQGFDGAKLSAIKRSILEKFWGPDVVINPGAELTWMRQSHYYMGLYSYTYSASLAVSTQAFLRILQNGQPAIDQWLDFLALGDSLMPVQAAQIAGVDITNDQALKATIHYLAETVDKISELTKKII